MREIKFRIWDKCNERMVEPRNILKICMSRLNQEPYLIVYLKKWMNPNREIREIDKCYTNEFELMQYTGLKDKNGTEIYEDDLVAVADYANWEGLYKVAWDNDGSMYVIEDAHGDREKLCEFEEYLVKGNIHDLRNWI